MSIHINYMTNLHQKDEYRLNNTPKCLLYQVSNNDIQFIYTDNGQNANRCIYLYIFMKSQLTFHNHQLLSSELFMFNYVYFNSNDTEKNKSTLTKIHILPLQNEQLLLPQKIVNSLKQTLEPQPPLSTSKVTPINFLV